MLVTRRVGRWMPSGGLEEGARPEVGAVGACWPGTSLQGPRVAGTAPSPDIRRRHGAESRQGPGAAGELCC